MVLNPALNNVGFLELILYRAQHPHSQDHAHLEASTNRIADDRFRKQFYFMIMINVYRIRTPIGSVVVLLVEP